MDISVSRLNNRMALRVPTELPLGLVFVVGKTKNLTPAGDEIHFNLVEAEHIIFCRLPQTVASETLLKDGDMARASGQLVFDPFRAAYILLARDVQIIAEVAPGRVSIMPILSDVRKRSQATTLIRSELPQWVKQLAPPEIQAELGLEPTDKTEEVAQTVSPHAPQPFNESPPTQPLSSEMLAFLSQAMDSESEVELTPSVISQFKPPESEMVEAEESGHKVEEVESVPAETPELMKMPPSSIVEPSKPTPRPDTPNKLSPRPGNSTQITLAILSLFVLAILLILAFIVARDLLHLF